MRVVRDGASYEREFLALTDAIALAWRERNETPPTERSRLAWHDRVIGYLSTRAAEVEKIMEATRIMDATR